MLGVVDMVSFRSMWGRFGCLCFVNYWYSYGLIFGMIV